MWMVDVIQLFTDVIVVSQAGVVLFTFSFEQIYDRKGDFIFAVI
jgi:hypothetical protein